MTVVDVLQILVGFAFLVFRTLFADVPSFSLFRAFAYLSFVFCFLSVRADVLLLFLWLFSCHPVFLQFVVLVDIFVRPRFRFIWRRYLFFCILLA